MELFIKKDENIRDKDLKEIISTLLSMNRYHGEEIIDMGIMKMPECTFQDHLPRIRGHMQAKNSGKVFQG
jgi:hypothetical protein